MKRLPLLSKFPPKLDHCFTYCFRRELDLMGNDKLTSEAAHRSELKQMDRENKQAKSRLESEVASMHEQLSMVNSSVPFQLYQKHGTDYFNINKFGKFIKTNTMLSDSPMVTKPIRVAKLPMPSNMHLDRVKMEATPQKRAPPTPEPSTPADNERSDPTFDIARERRRTNVVKSSASVSHLLLNESINE